MCLRHLKRSILKSYWKKYLVFILAGILFVPVVRADDCGLTNLATCIPQKFYEYFLSFINSPLQPLLTFIKNLFVSPPSIALFGSVWAIIVYLISIFYTFLFLYAGFQFLVSGHNVVQREMAKEWLKNTVIMIVLIQASYYLYGLVVDIGSTLTSAILSMVDSHFFMLTVDNISNSGLELIFTSVYLIVLLITKSKIYYFAPIYPVLFAGGAVMMEKAFEKFKEIDFSGKVKIFYNGKDALDHRKRIR